MSDIPLALTIAHFSPYTLLDDTIDENDPHPLPNLDAQDADPKRIPVPDTFAFSPTHSYTPDPFPAMSLGSTLRLGLQLGSINTGEGDRDVRGVRMMCEIQGPGGRYRLGEVVHSEKRDVEDEAKAVEDGGAERETAARPSIDELAYGDMSRLAPGQTVDLDVQNEMKELGLQVLIVSVAWETEQGRRTFQRFYKFHVNAPLAIKTRIHTSTAPNTALDPIRRTDVYLEVLMQNTSPEIMAFDKIELEPVYGLSCMDVTSTSSASSGKSSKPLPLYPNDTRQHLFLLRYTPPQAMRGVLSAFPPFFPGGSILPLGRLDVGWVAGKYAEPGRLQTSTLNRRTAVTPIAPSPADADKPLPTRTTSALAPAPGPSTPAKSPVRAGASIPAQPKEDEWEYDLCVTESRLGDGAVVEEEVVLKVRVAMRSLKICADGDEKPPPVTLGIQHLEPRPLARLTQASRPGEHLNAPSIAFSPPSRSATPLPGTPATIPTATSRPSTPLSAKLRQATAAQLTPRGLTPVPGMARTLSGISQASGGLLPPATIDVEVVPSTLIPPIPAFPPAPTSARTTDKSDTDTGEVYYLGNTLIQTPSLEFTQAQEQYHTSYAESAEPPLRWEAVGEVELRWVALSQGLADLGGIRVLNMSSGTIGREWDSVGQVWVKSW